MRIAVPQSGIRNGGFQNTNTDGCLI